jgi:signal transduction histidine kinase
VRIYPRSLTGQIAFLIAVALFVAQAINFGLLVRERSQLRFEQATRPSVVRLVDAAERLAAGRPLPGNGDRARRRPSQVTLVPTDPIDPRLEHVPEVDRAIGRALDEAGVKHGRIATGIRALRPDDPRLRRVSPDYARRLVRRTDELLIAVEVPGRGWLTLSVGWPRENAQMIMRLIAQTLILYAIVLLPVLWLGRRISRPMRELTTAARGFGRTGPGEPLEESGPEDVRALIAAFNELSARVHGMLDEKDRMLGAIGHDLRTPLAALRVRIESVDDDNDRARMADTIDEMSRTLDDILSLARLGRPSEPATDVDLTALVDAVVDDFRELDQPVTLADAPRVVMRLRPALMRRAVRNLIENAVKYGGEAEVSIIPHAQVVHICVADRGPGIPPDRIADVFESFTRLEQSRNRESGGVGLGLALTRGIVREAGGDVALTNRDGGGLLAEIVLPKS